MNEHVTWQLRGKFVTVAENACIPPRFQPGAEHHLCVKMALDKLTNEPDTLLPGRVTVDELAWPVRATIEPNDLRQPVWAVHAQHEHLSTEPTYALSPFVFMNREQRPPTTKSLTFDFAGTNDYPILMGIHVGDTHPPLPWQLSAITSEEVWQESIAFWQTHSFVYDRSLVATAPCDDVPSWFRPMVTASI